MDVQISGTRVTTYLYADGGDRQRRFHAGRRRDNLVFDGFDFSNVGTAFRLGADISNITIQNMEADNIRRFVSDLSIDRLGPRPLPG